MKAIQLRCAALVLIFLIPGPATTHAAETVTVDVSVTNQSIRSWGAPAGMFTLSEDLRGPVLDELVNSLGLTRLRFEPSRREWETPLNDDADPFHENSAAFITTTADDRVQRIFLPFKQRVEANGERFEFYVSPSFFNSGSSGAAPAWLLNSPGEYAEWATTFLQYLRQHYDLLADYYSICNEAGNNNSFTAAVVASLLKTLAPRLEGLGFRTKMEFPECVNADTSWNYIQSTSTDDELWRYVGLVSYHLYGGNTSRTSIRDFARARNLPTGQTEYMGLNLNYLYDDLTLGGVSTWEFYALNDILPLDASHSWFSRTQTYWQTRQVLHFVRPEGIRVEATTSTNALRALAFLQNGATLLVLLNTTDGLSRTIEVTGLVPGVYGRSQTVGASAAQELGLVTVAPAAFSVSLPANSTLTLYPSGPTNLAPVVQDWRSNPSFLKQPASTVSLSTAASDPEAAVLSYEWSVADAPLGAPVYLVSPQSASCTATGLITAGTYVFAVKVSDGVNTLTRRVPVRVLNGNQAPELSDVHNRIPTVVTLPTVSTTLRSAGWDLEGDTLSFEWSVLSQPAGAAATLLTPNASACVATNLSVPGDYLFRIILRDPTHAVSNELHVAVWPTNHSPVISAATASPANLTLPLSATSLEAATSDADGDPVSHWWTVSAAPVGALPLFTSPGSNVTAVTGLIIPGTYTFKVTAVDRAGFATRNVIVTVGAGGSPALLALAAPNGGETYTAGQTVHIRWSSFQVASNVKLEFYDGATWQTIADSIPNDGMETWTVPRLNATGCRVRVSTVDNATAPDQSDGVFSITTETPRFHALLLTNGVPLLELDQEPGRPNRIQRKWELNPSHPWETVAEFTNSSQTVLWSDTGATNSPSAFYRVLAE